MGTIEENKKEWDFTYPWTQRGDEWSAPWGGPYMQWYTTILPRIHEFVPAQTILEIAPGYGRWTRFLKDVCSKLILVDLSENCIKACQSRFSKESHLHYHLNDGKSLEMIPDNSIDFLFSFDALVHAEDTVIASYISELSKKLKKNGVAFIHHSNLGEYACYLPIPKFPKLRNYLLKLSLLEPNLGWRSFSMTAAKMEQYAKENGLRCLSQEVVNWFTRFALIDCFSTIVKEDSIWSKKPPMFRNRHFMREAKYVSKLSRLYEPVHVKNEML